VLGGRLLGKLPLVGQRLGSAGQARAQREHAETVPARGHHAGRVMTLATAIGKHGSV